MSNLCTGVIPYYIDDETNTKVVGAKVSTGLVLDVDRDQAVDFSSDVDPESATPIATQLATLASNYITNNTKSYQEWDYVMKICGTEMSSMTTGLKTLTNKLDDAKNGSESAQAMFAALGISMEDMQKMSREDLFKASIAGLQKMGDSTERAALANDLFGKSSLFSLQQPNQ